MKIWWYVIAIALCSDVHGQCVNGQCYRPVFSASSVPASGKVLRTRSQLPDGTWGPWRKADGTTVKLPKRTGAVQSSGLMPGEINRDSRAYAHAKREAQMLANGMWHNSRRAGHPLGTAPGCNYSGTGVSTNGMPNHCYLSMPESRIVARACVVRNGRYFWSCHLR